MTDYETEIKNLVYLCRNFSRGGRFVQGGGGNISVKLDDELMAIKSSGVKLLDVTKDKGISTINYKRIKEYYGKNNCSSEYEANNFLMVNTINGSNPSMEAGFHSFGKKFVVHLHPVHPNVILCSNNAGGLELAFYRKSQLFRYAKPGHVLAKVIYNDLVLKNKEQDLSGIIFLENHGIIVSSDDLEECIEKIDEIDKKSIEFLRAIDKNFEIYNNNGLRQKKDFFINDSRNVKEFFSDSENRGKYLFPDAVVFLDEIFAGNPNFSLTEEGLVYNMSKDKAQSIDEIVKAHTYINQRIVSSILEPKYLNPKEIIEIKVMPSEKYRQKVAGI